MDFLSWQYPKLRVLKATRGCTKYLNLFKAHTTKQKYIYIFTYTYTCTYAYTHTYACIRIYIYIYLVYICIIVWPILNNTLNSRNSFFWCIHGFGPESRTCVHIYININMLWIGYIYIYHNVATPRPMCLTTTFHYVGGHLKTFRVRRHVTAFASWQQGPPSSHADSHV